MRYLIKYRPELKLAELYKELEISLQEIQI